MAGQGVLIMRLFHKVNKGRVCCFMHVSYRCSRLRQAGSDGQRESLWRPAACPSPQYGQNVGDPPG